jgi:hypothetical protein
VLTLIASLAIALATPDPTVSLTVPATQTSKILATLEASTGVRLSVEPRFKETPLVVSVHDVPLSKLLANMCVALRVEMQPAKDGYRLARPAKMQTQILADEQADYATEWKSVLDKWQATLVANPWSTNLAKAMFDKEAGRYGSERKGKWERDQPHLDQVQPGSRLLFKLMNSLGPTRLAQMDVAQPTVFSRFPTPMQSPMPKQFEAWLATYIKESSLNPPPAPDEDAVQLDDRGRVSVSLPALGGRIGKVLVSFDRGSITMMVFNEAGTTVDAVDAPSIYDFYPEPDKETRPSPYRDLEPFEPTGLSKQLIEFSDSVSTNDHFNGEADDSPPVKISPELKEFLMNPDRYDPLSLLPSELLHSFARQRKLNLVVQVDDSCSDPGSVVPEGGSKSNIDLGPALEMMFVGQENASTDEGWWVIAPYDQVDSDATRLSRTAFASYLHSSAATGFNLDADVSLMASIPGRPFDSYFYLYSPAESYLASIFGPHEFPDMLCARFLAGLTGTQRRILVGGGTVPASSLSRPQLTALARWIYSPDEEVGHSIAGRGSAAAPLPMYSYEVTELLPTGLPPGIGITLRTETKEGFYVYGTVLSAKFIAAAFLMAEKTNEQSGSGSIENGSVQHGTSANNTVSVTFPNGASFDTAINYAMVTSPTKIGIKDIASESDVKAWIERLRGASTEQLTAIISQESRQLFGDERG